jgi:cytochrome c-type biogenesis protein CcmH
VDFIVARYGEYVLLEPTKDGFNMILWVAPLGMLLLALGAGFATVRRKGTASSDALTDAEKARLEEIMKS